MGRYAVFIDGGRARSHIDSGYRCSYDCRRPACGSREQVRMRNPRLGQGGGSLRSMTDGEKVF